MRSHVSIAAWLHIIMGSLVFAAGFALFVAVVVLGLFALPSLPIIGAAGVLIFSVFALFSVPSIAVGVGMLHYRPWARIVGIGLAAVGLVFHPAVGVGTIIGIYTLYVLLHPETKALFDSQQYSDSHMVRT
ncbi:MAG TPA: hypothetical protein VFJ58_18530 [Armatimonadota bacterium]|nr:hypothetical protein [Armatimonadota bacterium]